MKSRSHTKLETERLVCRCFKSKSRREKLALKVGDYGVCQLCHCPLISRLVEDGEEDIT